jgi:AbrB family looped-hinge helix DNA binding protein
MSEETLLFEEERIEPAFAKVSRKGQILIPKVIRENLGLDEGADLLLVAMKNNLVMTKFDKDFYDVMLKLLNENIQIDKIKKIKQKTYDKEI